MPNLFIRTAIRSLFTLTSREKALRQCKAYSLEYKQLAQALSQEAGAEPVHVPAMRGVDPEMRDWSLWMLLEHNTIVNRSITATVVQLARGEALHGAATLDPKHGVLPSNDADASQLEAHTQSITEHVHAVRDLPKLRGTATSRHPVFGPFDAHKWHCMFAFHLSLHLPQARAIVAGTGQR